MTTVKTTRRIPVSVYETVYVDAVDIDDGVIIAEFFARELWDDLSEEQIAKILEAVGAPNSAYEYPPSTAAAIRSADAYSNWLATNQPFRRVARVD